MSSILNLSHSMNHITALKDRLLSTKAFSLILAITLLLTTSKGFTLEFESDAPIEVASDSAEIDDTTGVAIYRGSVEVTQGEAKLSADLVVVSAANQQLSKISAEGSPSIFEQIYRSADETIVTKGQANSIIYEVSSSTLTFDGHAKVEQNSNSFEGSQIIYDLKERAIKAESNPEDDTRVRIRYLPTTAKTEPQDELPQPSPVPADNTESSEPELTQSSEAPDEPMANSDAPLDSELDSSSTEPSQ